MNPPRDAPHLPSLDGLRGLAILLVMPHNLLVHTQVTSWWSHGLLSWFERGWTGVQLFFALSGFLITGILLDTAGSANRLRVFYARRVLRIFPLYFLALGVVLVGLPALHWPAQQAPQDGTALWWAYWVFLSNWVDAPAGAQPSLPHFWSLAVEEQFYLLWPLVVVWLRPRQVVGLGLGLAAVSLLARVGLLAGGYSPDFVYESTVGRMDTLVLGGAAAAALREPAWSVWLAGRRDAVLGTALAALLLALGGTGLHAFGWRQQTLGYEGLSLACVATVLWAALWDQAHRSDGLAVPARRRPAWGEWWRMAWLRHLGRYSYGLYVVHVPLGLFLGYPLLRHGGYQVKAGEPGELLVGVPLLLYLAACMGLSYALALASYHGVERHCLRRKPAYRWPPAR